MLLAIDIGNTRVSFGVFRRRRLVLYFNLPTCIRNDSLKLFQKNIKKNLSKAILNSITEVVICSVVPSGTNFIRKNIEEMTNAKVVVLGKDVKIPIKNLYKNPQKVGQDRLVNAYAAVKLYGPGLILIDFGTAVTFDVVSKKGEYMGGLIHPGLGLSLKALHENTALLPNLRKDFPKKLIGQDTKTSILSGVVFGIAEMCDGLIARIQKKYKKFTVIATGGDGKYIKRYCSRIGAFDNLLTIKGIMYIYESIKRKV